MLRKTLNASRLQDEVSRRLHKLQEVVDDGVKIVVPRPQLQEPDRTGCNWTMRHFGNAAGFESSIAAVLAKVQAEYNLASDANDDHEEKQAKPLSGDPFGGSKPVGEGNPFGETKRPAKVDPFGGGDDSSAQVPKRSGNPFGDD